MPNIDPLINNVNYWKKLFQESPVGLCFVDREGKFLKVNYALSQLLGYTESELTGKTWQAVTHPDDLEADKYMVNKILNKDIDYYEMNKRYLHKMGGSVWARLTVHPIFNENGDFNHFVSHISSLLNGERLKAENAANNANNRIIMTAKVSLTDFWKDNWKTLTSILLVLGGSFFGGYFQLYQTNSEQNVFMATFAEKVNANKEDIDKNSQSLDQIKKSIDALPSQIRQLLNEQTKKEELKDGS